LEPSASRILPPPEDFLAEPRTPFGMTLSDKETRSRIGLPNAPEGSPDLGHPGEARPWPWWQVWGLAFLVRLLGVGFGLWLTPGFLVADDTRGLYYPIARSLAAGHGFRANGSYVLGSCAPPLFTLWLALLMRVAGPDLPVWLPGLFNAAFRAGGVVLLYQVARRYFGEKAGRWAAVLYLADPWEALWVGYVLKESLGVPLLLLTLWMLSRLADEPRARWAWGAGLAIGLATLARFPNLALWVAAAGVLLVGGRTSSAPGGTSWRRTGVLFGYLTAATGIVLLPWVLHNWQVVGQPVLCPHFVGRKFYTSNGPGIEMERDGYYSPQGVDRSMVATLAREKTPWQVEGYLLFTTVRHVATHPQEAAQRVAVKLVNMWQPTFQNSSSRNWLVLGWPYCLLMGLSLGGVVLVMRRRTSCPVLWVPLLTLVCLHLVFWGEIRNRQYLTPLLFAFGGVALASLRDRLVRRWGDSLSS